MPSRRNRLLADVKREIAAARGLARAVLAVAESGRAEARGRLDLGREAHTALQARLTEQCERAKRDVDARFRRDSARLAGDLAAVAAARAPGAAGAPWSEWMPTTATTAPLQRIGAIDHPECDDAVPALVPLLDRAHLWLAGDRSTVDGVLAALVLRALGATRPGDVRVAIYDPERLGGSLPGFAPLVAAGLVTYVGPGGLTDLLDGLVEDVRRINESVLGGDHASLAGLAAANGGRRSEPWRLAVFLGDAATAEELTAAQRAQLDRIARTGVPCGVHLLVRGLPVPTGPAVERIRVTGGTARAACLADLPVLLDPPPRVERVAAFCRGLADRVLAGPAPIRFADLLPDKPWTESSAAALLAPVGADDSGAPAEVLLGDDPPHALVGGPSGSGKTNLLYAWLGGLCARYSPDELALYLLDFKEGVSFARFAPSPRDPSWLPHVRLVGVNVNNDREFGLALLRHLGEELRRRARAAKRYEAAKLAELRAEDPGGHWPRIVAVVDEFQVLLGGRDAVTAEAVTLLEDLARRGRSQGIHLVLASQDVSGIEALWGRSGLVGQFTLRIALPKARRILHETNLAAETVPRHCAVVNAESGVRRRQPDRAGARRGRPHGLARAAGRPVAPARARRGAAPALRRRRGAGVPEHLAPRHDGAGGAARRDDRRRRAAGDLPAAPCPRPQPGRPGHPHRRRLRGAGRGRAFARDAGLPVQRRVPRRRRPAVRRGAARGAAGRAVVRPGHRGRAAGHGAGRRPAARRRRVRLGRPTRRRRRPARAADPRPRAAGARAGLVAHGRPAARRPRRRRRPPGRDRRLGGAGRARRRPRAALAAAGRAGLVAAARTARCSSTAPATGLPKS